MRFASLGSGSRGNATLVSDGTTTLLVDCGFSCRETERRLHRLKVQACDLDAILVTHEHSDHCAGVARLAAKYDLPVHLSRGTYETGRCGDPARVHFCRSEENFTIGELDILPIAVPHDAREPCQFIVRSRGLSLGILTDIGSVTPFVSRSYRRCDALILECNHDVGMLFSGTYPESVKRRVGGDWGHLNNEQSAELLASLELEQLQHLVVAHISEQNNSLALAQSTLSPVIPNAERVVWACQQEGFDWLEISAPSSV